MTAAEPEDYLREIERAFVGRRRGALFLTPADWEVAREWEERGIPLPVALSGIGAALARRGRISPGTPLRVCSPAVDQAFAVVRRREAGAAPLPPAAEAPQRSRLERLAASLEGWTPGAGALAALAAPRAAESAVRDAAGRVRALREEADSDPEPRLAEIERELLDRLEAALTPAARERMTAEAGRGLAPRPPRLPEPIWRNALTEAVRRRVGEALGVPPVTLLG